jgi:hypothetical protein
MDIRVRRALLPALLAAALLLVAGWHAVPAGAASVDPELVAESVSEDGYYVDSGASYLKSDADLDKLRAALNDAGRAGVVVLPAGTASGPVISRLLQEPNRTYIVLTGSNLQATSNNMPAAKVKGMLARAKKAGDPKAEVIAFLDLMGGKHPAATKPKKKAADQPSPGVSNGTDGAVAPSTSPVAAAKKDSGGNVLLYAIIGAVIVLAAAGGGFLLWRRRQQDDLMPPPPPVA